MSAAPLVVVSVGTYHLPFDRLVDWVGDWSTSRPTARLVVQHGVSRPLPGAENHAMLPHADLLASYASASAVVVQGGAGGAMDAVALGVVPIMVPRVPELDEVVDRHQVVFARELARLGVVHLAEDRATLCGLLDQAVRGALITRSSADFSTPGSQAVSRALSALPVPQPSRVRRRRLLRASRLVVDRTSAHHASP